MSRVVRASDIIKLPVVTMAGDDVAQVKDVIYSAALGGELAGFTLAGRGIFAGPLDRALAWSSVAAVGEAAVMISGDDVLEPVQDVLDRSASTSGQGDNELGAQLLTDDGGDLGTVVDFVVRITDEPSLHGDVIGCEVVSSGGGLGDKGTHAFVPLPSVLAASGEHVIVPAKAKDFATGDLAALEGAATDFRTQQEGAQ